MPLNKSFNNGVNEARTDNCEALLPDRYPTGKQYGHCRHQNTARKRWTQEENECIIYGMKWECLKLKSNTLHAKIVAFSRTRDLQKLRFNSCEKRLRRNST